MASKQAASHGDLAGSPKTISRCCNPIFDLILSSAVPLRSTHTLLPLPLTINTCPSYPRLHLSTTLTYAPLIHSLRLFLNPPPPLLLLPKKQILIDGFGHSGFDGSEAGHGQALLSWYSNRYMSFFTFSLVIALLLPHYERSQFSSRFHGRGSCRRRQGGRRRKRCCCRPHCT